MRAEGHDGGDRLQAGLDRFDRGHGLAAHDEHVRLGVVGDSDDLVRREPEVDSDRDRVELGRPEEPPEVLKPATLASLLPRQDRNKEAKD
jgi:hypothetical protein